MSASEKRIQSLEKARLALALKRAQKKKDLGLDEPVVETFEPQVIQEKPEPKKRAPKKEVSFENEKIELKLSNSKPEPLGKKKPVSPPPKDESDEEEDEEEPTPPPPKRPTVVKKPKKAPPKKIEILVDEIDQESSDDNDTEDDSDTDSETEVIPVRSKSKVKSKVESKPVKVAAEVKPKNPRAPPKKKEEPIVENNTVEPFAVRLMKHKEDFLTDRIRKQQEEALQSRQALLNMLNKR